MEVTVRLPAVARPISKSAAVPEVVIVITPTVLDACAANVALDAARADSADADAAAADAVICEFKALAANILEDVAAP